MDRTTPIDFDEFCCRDPDYEYTPGADESIFEDRYCDWLMNESRMRANEAGEGSSFYQWLSQQTSSVLMAKRDEQVRLFSETKAGGSCTRATGAE